MFKYTNVGQINQPRQ